ncbi:nitrite reductase (NAD(P)H) small subunit [Streptomyces winkii]|uniref:nitrite reductase (NAD(P)H) small subunit n=1 Tax=Streptomyces winkii TaxID=3051178 RepID=UPI0037D9F259
MTALAADTQTGTETASADSTTAAGATAARRVEVRDAQGWFAVCRLGDLVPGRGVAALLRDGSQAAVFMDRAGRTYVIGNRDPFTGAYVLSRGLLGSAPGGTGHSPFVASPLLKQRFDLRTGHCLDDDAVSVPVFDSRTR